MSDSINYGKVIERMILKHKVFFITLDNDFLYSLIQFDKEREEIEVIIRTKDYDMITFKLSQLI